MGRGRGWHGESGRHRQAALKGKLPGKSASARDAETIKRARDKMDRILKQLGTGFGLGLTYQMSVRQQDKLTNDLEEIIEMLETVKLPDWMEYQLDNARIGIKNAWSYEDKKRVLGLEAARERLHLILGRIWWA